MMNFKDPISLSEAAKLVGETASNFRWFIVRGETPEYIRVGRCYVFSKKDILEWVKPFKKTGGWDRNGKRQGKTR